MKRDDLLDLNDALQHPGRKIAVDLSTELPQEEDLDLVNPLEGFLEAMSTGNQLLITGEFKTRCVLDCSRCGAPIEQDVEFTMDEQFMVEGVPSMYAQDDHAKVVNDEEYPLFEHNHLIVENLLRQGLIINLPLQVLCEHGWEGACPEAEKRLREIEIEAAGSAAFARLQQLKEMEERQD
jgi:uncharacterized protein